MKFSKRLAWGLTATAGTLALSGAAAAWVLHEPSDSKASSDGVVQKEPAALPDDTPAKPIPLAFSASDEPTPFNPIRQVDFEVPSPSATVIRGNDESPDASPAASRYSTPPEPPNFGAADQEEAAAPPPSAPSFSGYGSAAAPYDPYGDTAVETDLPPQSPAASAYSESAAAAPRSFEPPRSTPMAADASVPAGDDVAASAAPSSTTSGSARTSYGDDAAVVTPGPQPLTQAPAAGAPWAEQPLSAPAAGTVALAANAPTTPLVADSPGPRQLEGPQAPALAVEKIAPDEIQVNIPAKFEIVVANVGDFVAHDVQVVDQVPLGTQLIKTTPEAAQTPEGRLVWRLGDLQPGEEVVLIMELLPQTEGEIGSVAQVSMLTQASARAICTRPLLSVSHSAPARVLIGEDVVFAITVKNPGTGDAANVVIEEDVPEGLAHAAGRALEYELGTLRSGEERRLELVLQAAQAGMVENVLRVRGNGQLLAEDRVELEVTAPQLEVAVRGPTRRYLDREVTYDVTVANPGTAAATNVDLVTYLPKGLEFIAADNKGSYDAQSHAVVWSLEALPADETGTVKLTALPVETGEQKLRVEGRADLSLSHKFDHTTVVDALTELEFTVRDVQDPIEVGAETTYEVRIINRGSTVASNVQMSATLPPALTAVSSDGATQVAVQAQQVMAAPIPQLAPGGEAVYRIKVQGLQAGDHLINVQLATEQVPTPVTKQESTKVYADQ